MFERGHVQRVGEQTRALSMKSQRRQSPSAAVPFHLLALTAHLLLDHALLGSVAEDCRAVSIQAIVWLMTSKVLRCRLLEAIKELP